MAQTVPVNYVDPHGLMAQAPGLICFYVMGVLDSCEWTDGGSGGGGGGGLPPGGITGTERPAPPDPSGGGGVQGSGGITAINNLAHSAAVDLTFAGIRAAFMNPANSDCESWFSAAFMTSDNRTYGSLDNYLVALGSVSGAGSFVGGNANAVANSPLTPGTIITVNTNGGFFKPLSAGQTLAPSNDFASQFAAINGGSDQARVFIMLHEIAHTLGMIRSGDGGNDAQSQANQRFNNDQIWRNCSGTIGSFSNRPY